MLLTEKTLDSAIMTIYHFVKTIGENCANWRYTLVLPSFNEILGNLLFGTLLRFNHNKIRGIYSRLGDKELNPA